MKKRTKTQVLSKVSYQVRPFLKIIPAAKNEAAAQIDLQTRLKQGGVGQISYKGGSTWFALTCLSQSLDTYSHADPPLSLWISDIGVLYPEALHHYWKIPLARFLQVQAPSSKDVWNVAVESAQTGLFAWIFVRTEGACHATELRRLQLASEKSTTRVLVLGKVSLPHWNLKCHLKDAVRD